MSLPSETLKRLLAFSETQWVTPFRVLVLMSGMFFLIYLDRGTMASTGVNGTEADDCSANQIGNSTDCIDSDGSGLQGEFGLSNAEDGVLSSMFMIGMSIAIPVCSEAVYHVNAFRLAGVNLLIWTVATIFCGLSFDFYSIAFCRMFVGVGEAAIISLAPPYIDDTAPPEKKTLWLACLFLAVPVGYAAGYGYGGVIGSTLGWRAAFILEGFLMSSFVLFCFCAQPLRLNMRTASGTEEPLEEVREKRLVTFWRHTREIFAHRVYVYLLVGYVCYTAFIGIVAYWGAKAAKAVFGMEDIVTGTIAAVFGLSGTVLGGWVLDRIGSTIPKALTLSSICCIVPGIIAGAGFLLKPSLPLFIVIYSMTLLLLFSLQAPVQATILWSVPPNHRTLANGLSVLIIHLFGDVPAPPLFGALLDEFKHHLDMEKDEAYSKALCITASVLIIAAFFFLKAALVGRTAKDYRTLGMVSEHHQRTSCSNPEDEEAPHVPLLQQ